MMNRRPQAGDTEEDLLKFQQEFLSGQTTPAASLVRRPGDKRKSGGSEKGSGDSYTTQRDVVELKGLPSQAPAMSPTPPLKKSRFKAAREAKSRQVETTPDTDDPESRIDSQDTSTAAILSDIIERDTRNAGIYFPQSTSKGFPSVFHRGLASPDIAGSTTAGSTTGKKTKSLFAQQMERSSPSEFGVSLHKGQSVHTSKHSSDKPQHSNILQGSGKRGGISSEEADRIHQENLSQLSDMSEEEILAEQKKLFETLDPKLLAFLQAKKTAKLDEDSGESNPSKSEHVAMETNSQNQEGGDFSKLEANSETVEVPIEVKKDWVHMDVVEADKLAWMKELPPPRADNSQTEQPARFDFHGNVLPGDCDLPVTLGLHHHGDEPERAGYTLEELFQLCRSSNVQQRSLALQTLAKILTKAKEGTYVHLLQVSIFPTVLDAGLVFLIRWALDDSVDAVLISAISVLQALLVNPADERGLDQVFSWPRGVEVVAQCPVGKSEDGENKSRVTEEEGSEEIDAEVVKEDLIQGLVSRMTILLRLRHYLTVWRPQAPSVLSILSVLTRIARHSQTTAYQIMNCPGLLDTIVKEFLPTSWKPLDVTQPMSCLYGYPVPAAIRLLRTIAQAGRNMAAILTRDDIELLSFTNLKIHISSHNVLSQLMVYLSLETCDINLPRGEAVSLQTEAYRFWRVSLLYGLGTQHYLDMYTSLIEKLRRAQSLKLSDDNPHDVTLTTALITVLQAVVVVAGSSNKQRVRTQADRGSSVEDRSTNYNPIMWSHVTDLLLPVRALWEKVKLDVVENFQNKKQSLTLASSLLCFLKTFYSQSEKQDGVKTIELLEELEQFSAGITDMWKTQGFQAVLNSLSQHSNILTEEAVIGGEVSGNLPELTSGLFGKGQGRVVPILRPHCPVPFITSVLRMSHTACKIHKGLIQSLLSVVMTDRCLRSYLKKVVSHSGASPLRSNFFTRFENHLQYYIIKLVGLMTDGSDTKVYHSAALSLLIRLQHGDEHLVHDLLSTVIYNPTFISEGKEEELTRECLEGLTITISSDVTHLRSATQEDVHTTQVQLLQDALTNLATIRATYLTAFSHMTRTLHASRARHLEHPFETSTFYTSNIGECLLPSDWMFFPLVDLFNRSLTRSDSSSSSPALLQQVSGSLSWIYLLEVFRSSVLSPVSVTLKVTRVMCVFLAGNDLFLDRRVHCYLAALLREYAKPHLLERLDFEADIPGLTSFQDMYISLLQQYQAVSFGDSLFGCYVLLPLQQRHSASLRRAVWGEYSGVLRSLFIPVKELLIPLTCYLEPEETNVELVRLYSQCLLSATVRPVWAPVMYLIAVHHVNRFMYTQDGRHSALKHLLLKQVLSSQNQEMKKHVLYYKRANRDAPLGMEFYEELSPMRQQLINSVEGH